MTTTFAASLREMPGAGRRQESCTVGFKIPGLLAKMLSLASAKMEALAEGRGLF